MKADPRRPGLEPGPIATAVNVASGWSRYPVNNRHWWLWVPAFAGTTTFICPTGKSVSNSANRLSSPIRKNISVFPKSKSNYMIRRPVPLEGRFAIVTDAGRDAVDADALLTNGAEADGEDVWS